MFSPDASEILPEAFFIHLANLVMVIWCRCRQALQTSEGAHDELFIPRKCRCGEQAKLYLGKTSKIEGLYKPLSPNLVASHITRVGADRAALLQEISKHLSSFFRNYLTLLQKSDCQKPYSFTMLTFPELSKNSNGSTYETMSVQAWLHLYWQINH